MNKKDEERALDLYRKSIIFDGLNAPHGDVVKTVDRLIEAGITAANMTVTPTFASPLEAISGLKTYYSLFDDHGDKVIHVTTAQDIEKAKKEGKFGLIMGSQNADILGGDLNLLSVYKMLGLRIILLSYYQQNLLGEGCGERTDGGLSNFGIEVVEEMNRLRLLIDVAHSGDQVTTDAIKHSKHPILITHSNARGLVNHIRNKPDEQIKALAEKGGVIGVVAYSAFCEVRKGVRPNFEDLLDMIDYIVKLVGSDHVGLGLDLALFMNKENYESFERRYPNLRAAGGWLERSVFTNKQGDDDPRLLPEVAKGLVARGYSDGDVQKILGLNFLRVFKEVCG